MPADATHIACSYYFNTNNNSQTSREINYINNNETGNKNNKKEKKGDDRMEMYKAKPQYLNTYNLVGQNNISTNNSNALSSSIQSTSSNLTPNFSDQQDHSSKILFKNSLWLDLQWSKIKKIGAGLYNLGNNCYLNATLQCMAYTPSLSQWLVNRPHSPVCKIRPVKGFCSLCEVEKIIYDIFNSCNGFAKPNSLCFNIKKVSNVFGVGTQEDASEFFTTLLESMAKSIKFPPIGPTLNTSTKNINILDEIFSFQFRSRITCCNCGRLSDTFENTNSWPVDVKYITDIRKGMLHFLREEVLDGENSYKCDKCQRKVRATKKYSIQTAPNVLVINLKRFDFTYAGKLTHYVTYPETLSLKTFITESDAPKITEDNEPYTLRNVTYKLYGVLVHLGYTSHSGHYYSYVRGPNDIWYKADDTNISTVRAQDALDQNAYILFYNRVPPTELQVDTAQQSKTTPINSTFQSPLSLTQTTNISSVTSPVIKPFSLKQNDDQDLKKLNSSVQEKGGQNENIPNESNRFKLTFVPVKSENIDDESNSNRTLNYDQVLKIKKLNKRKLKFLNKKKKLKDLKSRKKLANDKSEVKSLKKRIKKLKKLIKKEKSKIKKLKRYESCSSGDDSEDDDDELTTDFNKNKRKLSIDETNSQNSESNKKTKLTNSLSLLKQYCTSSSSDDSFSSYSRSSRSSSRSSSSSTNESKRKDQLIERNSVESNKIETDTTSLSNSSQNNNEKTLSHIKSIHDGTELDKKSEEKTSNASTPGTSSDCVSNHIYQQNSYKKSWKHNYSNSNSNNNYYKFPKKNYYNNWKQSNHHNYSNNNQYRYNNNNKSYSGHYQNNYKSKSYHYGRY